MTETSKKTSCRKVSLTNQIVVKPFWRAATRFGIRKLTRPLHDFVGPYKDTLIHFETTAPVVALTIDDGLSRGGPHVSMVQDVLQLLKEYDATATFFMCTDYLKDQQDDVMALMKEGHELGNHMQEDLNMHYCRLPKEEFKKQLQDANQVLEELEQRHQQTTDHSVSTGTRNPRWFQAPQLILTSRMKEVMDDAPIPMQHVLGDCYCDDFQFAQDMDSKNQEDFDADQCRAVMNEIGQVLLTQAQQGSIAIFTCQKEDFVREHSMLWSISCKG
ncbi:Inherit from euNOG: Polysaccharide deacetylase [Seminavis robusta]|uniref:Inherit from euNOG: Polysaccharide deacetylase n=1 Tax=Seminavis robusta TaxID=568900 RepID=A0A9N8EKL8_9STRA|nr:Inherit from euNOG: Polysaccharide deacetylase [Seminavis robusta]|eukprot:Sro1265_g257480.1 Inherit from euNOG: Polysaccharide deacetylase (273) ;mRNA; r:16609-17427